MEGERNSADDAETVEVSVVPAIRQIDAADWDACASPETADGGAPLNPFVTHAFLSAMEDSGSATPREGWAPQHLVARRMDRGQDRVIGVMPLYLKGHSQGEYVFDHAWAHAWERAGGEYYPKAQSAVPFTPVTGPRLLVHPDSGLPRETVQGALMQGAAAFTGQNRLSSCHITFCTEEEWELGGRLGLLQRTDQQFHWRNRGYSNFPAFLAALASRKRKQIRKERAQAVENGVAIHRFRGSEIRDAHWDAFWAFYQDTGARKWGQPYLTRKAFDLLQSRMGDGLLLILAERQGRWIAGALNVIGRETLYGRYWGCLEDHPCLHFELCYYQAIDWAIAHGLKTVEAGAQGSHKLARGYEPIQTHSLHFIPDKGFEAAVRRYLDSERMAVAEEIGALSEMTPFRKAP